MSLLDIRLEDTFGITQPIIEPSIEPDYSKVTRCTVQDWGKSESVIPVKQEEVIRDDTRLLRVQEELREKYRINEIRKYVHGEYQVLTCESVSGA